MLPITSVNSVGGQSFWIACSRTASKQREMTNILMDSPRPKAHAQPARLFRAGPVLTPSTRHEVHNRCHSSPVCQKDTGSTLAQRLASPGPPEDRACFGPLLRWRPVNLRGPAHRLPLGSGSASCRGSVRWFGSKRGRAEAGFVRDPLRHLLQ